MFLCQFESVHIFMNEKKQVAHILISIFFAKIKKSLHFRSPTRSGVSGWFFDVFFALPRENPVPSILPTWSQGDGCISKSFLSLRGLWRKNPCTSGHVFLSQARFCKSAVPGWDFSSPSIGFHADCHWVGDDPQNYHGRQAGKSSQFYVLEYPSLLMHHLRPPTTIGYTHLLLSRGYMLKTKRLHMIYSKAAFHTF